MSPRVLFTMVAGLVVTGPSLSALKPAPSTPRAVEVKGSVRVGGRAASDLRLTFQRSGSAPREWRARIKSDGTYKVKVQGGDTGVICGRIERNRPFNSYSKCGPLAAGTHRLDFDLPPGLIRVEIPAFRRRAVTLASVRVESAKDSAGRSFKPAKGFRGDYLAPHFGTYVIVVTDPEHEQLLASWPVTLTADQPVVGVKLAVRRSGLSPSPTH